jgi:hypothetical protein
MLNEQTNVKQSLNIKKSDRQKNSISNDNEVSLIKDQKDILVPINSFLNKQKLKFQLMD